MSAPTSFLLLFSLCVIAVVHGSEDPRFFMVNISSLVASTTCTPTTVDQFNSNTTFKMPMARPYGPCNPFGDNVTVDPKTLLAIDDLRVQFRQGRLPNTSTFESKSAFPIQKGLSIGSGNFVVTIGLGTPMVNQTVEVDTGSIVTWVQCDPYCSSLPDSCYPQNEPKFNPFRSTTSRSVYCQTIECHSLVQPGCFNNSRCTYAIKYTDTSVTGGYLIRESLTLTPRDVVPNFVFGCAAVSKGVFGRAAGLIGLSRGPLSFMWQTSSTVFSYCLPSTASSVGHLTINPVYTNPSVIAYTRMLTYSDEISFYALELVGISVAGWRLQIPTTVFTSAETTIDSGTVVTRLPPAAYAALRTAFRNGMVGYPTPQTLSFLDTCYNVTGKIVTRVPSVALHFGGGVNLVLQDRNIVLVMEESLMCLAFAANQLASDHSIIGNIQQKGFEVVYDLGMERIGFGVGNYC